MIFVITEIFFIPTGTSSALRKKKTGKESQYIVFCPELGSDPLIGLDWESGHDKTNTLDTILQPLPIDCKISQCSRLLFALFRSHFT